MAVTGKPCLLIKCGNHKSNNKDRKQKLYERVKAEYQKESYRATTTTPFLNLFHQCDIEEVVTKIRELEIQFNEPKHWLEHTNDATIFNIITVLAQVKHYKVVVVVAVAA